MDYEIDFLPVGNGDSSGDAIAIRYGIDGNYKVIVIDGGTKESGENLVSHIKQYYNTNYVDYVLNTHPDKDHASGLSIILEKLEVGKLYIHRPWEYADKLIDYFKDQRMTVESLKRKLKENFSASYALEELAISKKISIEEPYEGVEIDCFRVISPKKDWYLNELIPDFNKTPDKKNIMEDTVKMISKYIKYLFETLSYETLKEGGVTSADNESSVILYTTFNDEKGYLFTGDAGIKALEKATNYAEELGINLTSNLNFIQIPHHGSRRNVSPSILDKILGTKGQEANKTAYVSAGKNAKKHPRQVVINAFIRRGCKVSATQGKTICYSFNMPYREGWSETSHLSFKKEVEEYE